MHPALIVVWLLLGSSTAMAQQPGDAAFKEEAARQQNIYQSKGAEVPSGYVIGRALAAYVDALPPGFDQDLGKLGARGRWLDIGAGEGQAILDYYNTGTPGERGQSIAISIEDRRTVLWHQTAARLETNKIRYLFGKSLNDYTLEELGKFQVISDLLGGFSYTRDLSRFMEKTLSLLDVNGSFYSILQDIHSEDGSNLPFYRDRGESYLTEILNPDDSRMKVCTWLKHISCVQVSCELRGGWRPPVEVYRVQKTCDNVVVPKLTPTRFTAGTPPERRFRLAPVANEAAR